jgi:hypothetical protein
MLVSLRSCCLVLAILALIACDKAVDPKGLSPKVYEGVVRATAALARANDRRDATNSLYEPSYLDAKKAVDDLSGTWGLNASDDYPKFLARDCLGKIQHYRAGLELLKLHANKGFERAKALDELNAAGDDIDRAIQGLQEFL